MSAPRFNQNLSRPKPLIQSKWNRFFDTTVPQFVKEKAFAGTPEEKLPFSQKDFEYFAPKVRELSRQFTVARGKKLPTYFDNPDFRNTYLLYWLPFQASKFKKIFERHQEHLVNLLIGKSTLKVLDLGAGPGSASFALKLFLDSLPMKREIKIDFTWVDREAEILKLGTDLAEKLQFTPSIVVSDWTKYTPTEKFDLVLVGGLLNETQGPIHSKFASEWIFIEPAIQEVSQNLIALRKKLLIKSPLHVVGPCMHEKECPMAHGKNWCHFSFLQPEQGKWFKSFSQELGSQRNWVKFSYLWMSERKQKHNPDVRLVISDPLNEKTGHRSVLLCEPVKANRYRLGPNERHFRGEFVDISERGSGTGRGGSAKELGSFEKSGRSRKSGSSEKIFSPVKPKITPRE